MSSPLLKLPDEILRQICEEFLGGDTALSRPILLQRLSDFEYGAVGREVPAFYSCRKLNQIILDILYSKQAYRIYIVPTGKTCSTELQLAQDDFLRAHGSGLRNIHMHINAWPAGVFDDVPIREDASGIPIEFGQVGGVRVLTKTEVTEDCCKQLQVIVNHILRERKSDIFKLLVMFDDIGNSSYYWGDSTAADQDAMWVDKAIKAISMPMTMLAGKVKSFGVLDPEYTDPDTRPATKSLVVAILVNIFAQSEYLIDIDHEQNLCGKYAPSRFSY